MNKLSGKLRRISQVDMPVFIFTTIIVVFSCFGIYIVGYTLSYNDMLQSLQDRVYSIYNYLEQVMDKSTFEDINTRGDMDKDSYRQMKALFHQIKQATGVEYLYTAKEADNGELIYVIDGLTEEEDFRYPGDPIEPEIQEALRQALDGHEVLPLDIKTTDWGHIFIAYLPIHCASDNVVGVIGIEFQAEHQWSTYRQIRIFSPLVILLTCLLSAIFAIYFFRRISNPLYQDLANTDTLTGLKNRNAFETDQHNLAVRRSRSPICLLLADLNGLKRTNDTLGHEAGDRYIQAMADSMREACTSSDQVLYRIGGDEFAVLMHNGDDQLAKEYMERLYSAFVLRQRDLMPHASFAVGWHVFSPDTARDFDAAYHQADQAMYRQKKEYYQRQGGRIDE